MTRAELERAVQPVRNAASLAVRFAAELAGLGPESHRELALRVASLIDSRLRTLEQMPAGSQQDAAVVRLAAAMRAGDEAGRGPDDFTKILATFENELQRLERLAGRSSELP